MESRLLEIMPALVEGCDVILGNEEDAEKVFGIKHEGFDVAQTNGRSKCCRV